MEEATTRPRSLDTLVTLECLEGVPDGGTLRVPAGARFTPAAEDEIWRRGLRLGPPEASELPAGPLRIAVGSDHGGFELKAELKDWLAELGHHARDLGTHDPGSCDYPDYARAVAEAVRRGYSEPDPRDDLSGEDVVRKGLILSRPAGLATERAEVRVEGAAPEVLVEVVPSPCHPSAAGPQPGSRAGVPLPGRSRLSAVSVVAGLGERRSVMPTPPDPCFRGGRPRGTRRPGTRGRSRR